MPAFRAESIRSLQEKIIIVTGGNAGLGFETVRVLSQHSPARIYLAARSEERANQAIRQIRENHSQTCSINFLQMDLASFDSIKNAVSKFRSIETRLDLLVNNAGIMYTPEGLTQDGFEIQFGTNVLGPALLTQSLLPQLRSTSTPTSPARVVFVASAQHEEAPSDTYNFDELRTTAPERHTTARYGISKLASIHYAKALAKQEDAVEVIPVHPGFVATDLHKESTGSILGPFMKFAGRFFATPVEKGVLSQLWAATSPDAKSGQYYGPVGKEETGSKLAQDEALQQELFGWVQEQVKPHLGDDA